MELLKEILLSSSGPVIIVTILFLPIFYNLNRRIRELEDELQKKKINNL